MAHFIATWLLPIFFALVGIELRNEIRSGTFQRKKELIIPLTAAVGGVIFPFLIYLFFVATLKITNSAWGVVVATDLPLALLALKFFNLEVAKRVRPYLLSLAIFDDLISIILIAVIYHQNGIHPTVYGFLIGFLLPLSVDGKFFKVANLITNLIIIPFFVIATLFENWAFEVGWLTLAVLIARMGGKPLGILVGNLISEKIVGAKILSSKDVLAVGTLGALGLSVSLLFAQISNAPKIAIASIFLVLPIAIIRVKVFSKFDK